jgi:hypothetical protein
MSGEKLNVYGKNGEIRQPARASNREDGVPPASVEMPDARTASCRMLKTNKPGFPSSA